MSQVVRGNEDPVEIESPLKLQLEVVLITNWHTFPGSISTVIPIACGITSMSLKMMAASKSNLRMGCTWKEKLDRNRFKFNIDTRHITIMESAYTTCSVTSQASSGVWQMVKKSCCCLVSRNSA